MKNIKYAFLSDLHAPDHDDKSYSAVLKFLKDYKPDKVVIIGDWINCTQISRFSPDLTYRKRFVHELQSGYEQLVRLINVVRDRRECEITYIEGNHEYRWGKFLSAKAPEIFDIEIEGEQVLTLPYLLQLKQLDIKWQPYMEFHEEHGILIHHGHIIRAKAGASAMAHLEKYGMSSISGDTHRLAQVHSKKGSQELFALEIGCLCNLTSTPQYGFAMDWQQGIAIAKYEYETSTFYPQILPIIKHSLTWGEKVYK